MKPRELSTDLPFDKVGKFLVENGVTPDKPVRVKIMANGAVVETQICILLDGEGGLMHMSEKLAKSLNILPTGRRKRAKAR